MYGYVGTCFGDGHNLAFYNNSCVTTGKGFGCPKDATMTVRDNKVYTSDGMGGNCKGASLPFPSDDALNAMGLAAVKPFPMAA